MSKNETSRKVLGKPVLDESLVDPSTKILSINLEDLEQELVQHPALMYSVGRQFARALSERDGAKARIKEAEVNLKASWRDEKPKPTEKSLDERVVVDRSLVGLRKELMDAEQRLRESENLKEAVIARGFAIHKIVNLRMAESGMNRLDSVSMGSNVETVHRLQRERILRKKKGL